MFGVQRGGVRCGRAHRLCGVTSPAPTRADHNRFCEVEGWTPVRRATGEKVSHHVTFELTLPDGRILRTRVLRPPDKSTYGKEMWEHILRDQLAVSVGEFWTCVRDETEPKRGGRTSTGEPLPLELVHLLRTRLHLSETEIASLSKQDAIERLNRYWQGR